MDLEAFRKDVERRGVKTSQLFFVNDCAFLPIHEEKDLRFLAPLFYEFESKSDFRIHVLTKPDSFSFKKLEDDKYFLSDREYSEKKLELLLEKQDFDMATVKTNSVCPVFFKFARK
ncbi:Uncharacterised protein [uncultured archaeon]|nr:Uncharacterised protein [uncultured archaeon]